MIFIVRLVAERLLYLTSHYMVLVAFQHGSIPCWIANNGTFFVATDYHCRAELAIYCSAKVERKKSQVLAVELAKCVAEYVTTVTSL